MKKLIHATVFVSLMLSSVPSVCGMPLVGRIASMYHGAKNKVQRMHASLLVDGMMRRAHKAMPDFIKGDSGFDTGVHVMLLACILYTGIKPLLAKDSDASKVLLGGLGWIFKMIGVDNLTVQGANYAQIAREKQEELADDVRDAVNKFTGEHVSA